MKIDQIKSRNRKFQEQAVAFAELVPSENLAQYSSVLIRGCKKIDQLLDQVLGATSEHTFWRKLDSLEETIDEIIFELDRLHDLNTLLNQKAIDQFIKGGYDLLSIYSLCCDHIIRQKTTSNVN